MFVSVQEGRELPEAHASVVAEQRARLHRGTALLRLPPRRSEGALRRVLHHPRAGVHLDRAMDRLGTKHQVSTITKYLNFIKYRN